MLITLYSRDSVIMCSVTQLCLTLCDPMDCSPPGSSVHGDSSGKNTGVGCHALLQGLFATQRSNPGLPPGRWILYHLSHRGSPFSYTYIHTYIYILFHILFRCDLTQDREDGSLCHAIGPCCLSTLLFLDSV